MGWCCSAIPGRRTNTRRRTWPHEMFAATRPCGREIRRSSVFKESKKCLSFEETTFMWNMRSSLNQCTLILWCSKVTRFEAPSFVAKARNWWPWLHDFRPKPVVDTIGEYLVSEIRLPYSPGDPELRENQNKVPKEHRGLLTPRQNFCAVKQGKFLTHLAKRWDGHVLVFVKFFFLVKTL